MSFNKLMQERLILTCTKWNDDVLEEILRHRVLITSEGKFDSVDTISTPDIRNYGHQFVNRKRELVVVPKMLQRINAMTARCSLSSSDLSASGIGKTWLLKQVRQE